MPEVTEGATRLHVPATNQKDVGPGRKEAGQPFYNPGMALNRDLSVLIVAAEARRKGREIDVADALCGTGARSLRLAHEVGMDGSRGKGLPLVVHANDGDASALNALETGRKANGIAPGAIVTTHGDAHVLLASKRHDVVDLDPYGSPMPFLDAVLRSTRPDGLVCVTATDTGALAGKYGRVCKRRYDAHHGLHAFPWRSEAGLRILAGAVVRAAARSDRAAQPLLCVTSGHWMRVVARVDEGRKDADAQLKQVGCLVPDELGRAQAIPLLPHDDGQAVANGPFAGPLWTGPLQDAAFVAALAAERTGRTLARGKAVDQLLPILADEAHAPPGWLFPDALQTQWGPPPRRDELVAALRKEGAFASRTHLDPQGVRTDANPELLRSVWGKA